MTRTDVLQLPGPVRAHRPDGRPGRAEGSASRPGPSTPASGRPAVGARGHADHAVDDVRPALGGRAPGLRVLPLGNPTRAALEACLASLEGAATASPSRRAWPPRTTCCGCCARATASCSATTRTAAPSG
jgi:hypothetical protein